MKRLFAILLALTMIVSIAGFAAAEEDKEITVWFSVWVTNNEKKTAQENWTIMKIARQFEAENPGVKVNMEFQADQQVAQNKLRAAVLAGAPFPAWNRTLWFWCLMIGLAIAGAAGCSRLHEPYREVL